MAKILVVEDNEHMHRIYAEKFRREGFSVVDAFDGEEALSLAASARPDVMLLDLMMPRMDGFEVLKRLKADPATADIPVLVISNKSQPVDVERALMLGARNFFHKGMTLLDDLALTSRQLCGLKKALIMTSRSSVSAPLREHLSRLRYVSSTSSIVVETVPRTERELPDVLLLDAELTGMNLSAMLSRLSLSQKAKQVPVILVGSVPPGTLYATASQVAGQLDVPIDPPKLEELLKRCGQPELQPAAA
jgi:CheY-like chemotaxis protein